MWLRIWMSSACEALPGAREDRALASEAPCRSRLLTERQDLSPQRQRPQRDKDLPAVAVFGLR